MNKKHYFQYAELLAALGATVTLMLLLLGDFQVPNAVRILAVVATVISIFVTRNVWDLMTKTKVQKGSRAQNDSLSLEYLALVLLALVIGVNATTLTIISRDWVSAFPIILVVEAGAIIMGLVLFGKSLRQLRQR